jgi:predicted GH43/DUF377 family glycosyl hydrolase
MVLEPDGSETETEGVLNPACARTPDNTLLLYPRDVARGNISRVGRVQVTQRHVSTPHGRQERIADAQAQVQHGDVFDVKRLGFALEPQAEYELRMSAGTGYGCEDPRVTYIPALKKYVMAYTAFGPEGPRIAVAVSSDAHAWERVGKMRFTRPGMPIGDDKDAAFFPEPVLSPAGVESFAFYHRPMLHISAVDGRAAIPIIEKLPFEDRESIRIGYVPVQPVLDDITNILDVHESDIVMSPAADWGSIKIGAGTPPVRIAEGWMSLYHGVDLIDNSGTKPKFRYSAGIVIHDARQPNKILYRSPHPVLVPESERERSGVVDNVVFPTGLDPRPDLGDRVFDVYYGMADYTIGAVRLTLAK